MNELSVNSVLYRFWCTVCNRRFRLHRFTLSFVFLLLPFPRCKGKKIHAVSRIHFSAISLTSFERWCARGATAVKKAYLMSVGLWPWTLVTDGGKTIKIHFGSKQSHTDASQATYFLHSSHSVTLFVNDFQLFGGNVKKVWISSNVFFEWLSFPLDIVV